MGNIVDIPLSKLDELTDADRQLIRSIPHSNVGVKHVLHLAPLIAVTNASKFEDFVKRPYIDSNWNKKDRVALARALIKNSQTVLCAFDSFKIMFKLNIIKINDQIDQIGSGCSCSGCGRVGSSLLLDAFRYRPEIARYLIKSGASVDIKNHNGRTPLYYAVSAGVIQFSIVEMLAMNLGSDRQLINEAIIVFSERFPRNQFITDLIRVTQILLDNGVDVNALGPANGGPDKTPLIVTLAMNNGIKDVERYIEFLFDRGADVNNGDGDGSTPLMWAIYKRNETLATMMLSRGATVNAVSTKGVTALSLATKLLPQFVPLLENLGAVDRRYPMKLRISPALDDDEVLPRCVICKEILTEPVTDSCGHTFDRACIAAHIKNNNSCPISRDEYANTTMAPNYAIREFIEKYVAKFDADADNMGVD